jgi:hypothetical protein
MENINFNDISAIHPVRRYIESGLTQVFNEKTGEIVKEFACLDKDFLFENELIDCFEYEILDDVRLSDCIGELWYQGVLV